MKKTAFFLTFALFLCCSGHSQTNIYEKNGKLYDLNIQKADSLLLLKNFSAAAKEYSNSFEILGWKGFLDDRYNAARAYAMCGVPDSAFFNLFKITEKMDYEDYVGLNKEENFKTLYSDARWAELNKLVKSKQGTMSDLGLELKQILQEDQQYRLKIDSIEKKHGIQSPERKEIWRIINEKDSINQIRVTQILDKYGWLGPEEVGVKGNSALFLVIQHSDLAVQEKYLPMMREAVKNGNAKGGSLALLEDRVNMRNGKKQIYGSQVQRPKDSQEYRLFPIEDAKNVDKRRAEVGLGPLAEYVGRWNITWNEAEAEKMDATPLEEKNKQ
jgi:hypothetical protein